MLIQDIRPHDEVAVKRLSNDTLIHELWERGVSIKTIFAKYYEREAAEDGRRMTVEDAALAVSPDNSKEGF